MTDVLLEHDFRADVVSDMAIGQRFLPASATKTQSYPEGVSIWTKENLMKLNLDKSKYTLHTRTKEDFA